MVKFWSKWVNDYPIVSLEDGLAFGGEELLGDRILIVDRPGTQLGIVGGELAPAGRQSLLDAGHEGTPSLR